MSFASWLEHHRRSLLFVAAALALAGIYGGVTLPVGLFPVVQFPRIRVEVDAGSMPARQMLLALMRDPMIDDKSRPSAAGPVVLLALAKRVAGKIRQAEPLPAAPIDPGR
jgi:hypothetical protein